MLYELGDIMDYLKLYNLPALMVTTDFEKVFDCLSCNFLCKTLEKFHLENSL